MFKTLFAACILLLLLCADLAATAAPPPYVWLESEAPAGITPTDSKPDISDWGKAAYLSGGKWLHISIDADKVEGSVPADGLVLRYSFDAPAAGAFELWNRIGYEKVRTEFDWRVDGGDWNPVTPDQNTVDVEELSTWNPVAWIDLGPVRLGTGAHNLEIRLPRTRDAKGALNRILYASDAVLLDPAPFHPDGPHRPGDNSWQAGQAAETTAFQAPTTAAPQTTIRLSGNWEIARDDELKVTDRTGPTPLPTDLDAFTWQAIPVPADRNTALPELTYVHQCLYRTHIAIPAVLGQRSFYLHFPSMNTLGTVYVNGQRVAFDDTPYAAFDCDITRAVRPGINELVVAIKDPFYALADAADAGHPQYTPYDFWHYNTTNQLDFPILSHYETGILQTPSLVVAGPVYTADVFPIPSVKARTLGLQITVRNPQDHDVTVQVRNEIVPLAGGPAAKTFTAKDLTVPAGQEAVLNTTEPWANPKLWWPDDPQQYNVVTRLVLDGEPVDERTTKFGFREWDWHGPTFTLNGIPWHGRADLFDYDQADDASVTAWREHGQNMQRLWGETHWGGKEINDALDFFDSHGVPIRRTGIFDGEGANGFYNLTEQVNENGKEVTRARKDLFDNWRRQLAAWVKGQRNHPSIFIWSMENEITFVNSSVFGNNPYTDPEMNKAAEMLAAIDPTRPQMTDGGNALLDQSLPVYGGHYMEPPLTSLPEGAYDYAGFAHRQKWPVTEVKPMLLGESFFATGVEQPQLAAVGGETAFIGKAEARPAMGLVAKMLSEGYRWDGVSFQFWFGGQSTAHYNSWQPVAALCREWNWTFGSGQRVPRTIGIFNDTRYADPITFSWTLTVGGRTAAQSRAIYQVAPGTRKTVTVLLPMPRVTSREEGQWSLALFTRRKTVFRDEKAVSVLPSPFPAREASRAVHLSRAAASRDRVASSRQLWVYDPAGTVGPFLHRAGVPFTSLASLDPLPSSGKVLVIGRDALTQAESGSSRLAAWAAAGRTVIVLEQQYPLKYQALPGAMAVSADTGDIAFPEDAASLILNGLAAKDFFTWGPDGLVYRQAYQKPTTGGRSLVECGDGLADTALAEMPAGKGLLLVCQLVVGQKLQTEPVAQRLLLNLISYGAAYHQVFRAVEVADAGNEPLQKALVATGLRFTAAPDAVTAIHQPGTIAVINASPANLHSLASNLPAVDRFARGGGWIILNNLTPEGLADYNRLVGVNHMIRAYGGNPTQTSLAGSQGIEKVAFAAPRNPLVEGLAASNIVMNSGKQILGFAAGQYPDQDAYGSVVDYDEVAPFGKSPFWAYGNITNGFTMLDGFWPLIINFEVQNGKPYDIPITLPRPQTITSFTWAGDTNYAGVTKVNLLFDGKDPVSFDTQPNNDPQMFAVNPPRTAKVITLQIADWQHIPAKQHDGKDLIGIDNIWLKAARPAAFYAKVRPILNIGALMEYPRGRGGIVLCDVKFEDVESVPENAEKKRTILATILRNLDAPFTGGKSIIAGASNLSYTPIDLSHQANQYVTGQGWFGDRQFTFADLPAGRHSFAGVPYTVYSFATSPVPTVIMLGGNGIPGNLPDAVHGIPVNRKADALFFLQAARIDQPLSEGEQKQGKKAEIADYAVHYADGTEAVIPVLAGVNIDSYRQTSPAALPGAQIAWMKPYAGTPESAVAYSMQWNNPKPDVPITSVDLIAGPDRRGVAALLALTAATAG